MKILLVGAGGYASGYVNALLNMSDPEVIFEGIVDPYYSSCAKKEEIDASSIPVYNTMEDFYSVHHADLAIICTPPFLHKEQSICALSHGSYVLCEKPIAPTPEDAEAMLEAEKKYGKWIAIGYQWSFSDAIQKLKSDILSGILGTPILFKTAISWPRPLAYYKRGTGWGGKISKDGIVILDSIASNACAHYLHNMLFLLGDNMNESADITSLCGECLRANDIENFDTCALKLMTDSGVPLYFIASHAAEAIRNPEFVYSFENAKVIFSQDDGSNIKAIFNDGREVCYGNPFENDFKKLSDCIDSIKRGTTPICTVKTALPHTRLIKKIYNEIPIKNFPKEQVCLNETEGRIFVRGLLERMYEAYSSESMIYFD